MKRYIVYLDGIEVCIIKAGSHNAAEKKAKKQFGHQTKNVSVSYTEL